MRLDGLSGAVGEVGPGEWFANGGVVVLGG